MVTMMMTTTTMTMTTKKMKKNPRRRNLIVTRRRKVEWICTTVSDPAVAILLLLVVMLLAQYHHQGQQPRLPSFHVSSLSITPPPPPPPPPSSTPTTTNTAGDLTSRSQALSSNEILNYQYNGFDLTYRKLKRRRLNNNDDESNNNSNSNKKKILLIHPIGVGLASWFWEPFMESLSMSSSTSTTTTGSTTSTNTIISDVYAPNLIGCGISEGSAAWWDPDTKGLFIPLDWARGCEELMDHVASKQHLEESETGDGDKNAATTATADDDDDDEGDNDRWTVIVQGGLAPVGVLLAHRNPNRVTSLIMTSPPRWEEMTTPVPENELKRNYDFLTNPFWGNLAFKTLESRRSVEFFSNQFLFSEPCDDTWLDNAQTEWEAGGKSARPPVQMFNAGFCMNRSFEDELLSLEQPTMVVQGRDDKRERDEYSKLMKNCIVKTSRGQNVLPWEYPDELTQEVVTFLSAI